MQAYAPIYVISKIPPPPDDPLPGRVVCIVAVKRDEADYSEVAHQLIHFMGLTKKRNYNQTLKSYLIVGHKCFIFKIGPRSKHVDVSRAHSPTVNTMNT